MSGKPGRKRQREGDRTESGGGSSLPRARGRFKRLGWLLAVGALITAAAVWRARRAAPARPGGKGGRPSPIVEEQEAVFARYAGSASCAECHEEETDPWRNSNHGLAERLVNPVQDRRAFDPPRRFRHGTQWSEARVREGRFEVVTLGFESNREPYQVVRVIGNDPLRQFLIPRPGGRLQVTEIAYDPHRNEWFDVYENEDRKPGEWGHWTGRGMNWNSMCAYCHNTRLRKNYEESSDSYRTAMAEMGVGCESCHGPMKDHVVWQRAHPDEGAEGKDPTLKPLTTNQMFAVCGSCHARRGDLTGDFRPGDSFFDHYSLLIVDDSEIYYPDGQVHEEDYEFAAFLGSKMQHAGVRCMDCHDSHRARPRLEGNDLCLLCHNGSWTNAPAIQPEAHSFHKKGEEGDDCRDCHMPITVYMARHPRHDHGFTIPDPLLTKQFGVPNACNRCHHDKDADWALEWCAKWYGEKMKRRTRTRAQWIARARRGEDAAKDGLLEMLAEEEIPYWRASLASLLGAWVDDPKVQAALTNLLADPHPLPREKAAFALEPVLEASPSARRALERRLEDSSRNVRTAAAWALRRQLDLESRAGRELSHMLAFNADHPGGRLQRAVFRLGRGKVDAAIEDAETAVRWDRYSAAFRHELAVLYSMAGRPQDALIQMQAACRLAPNDPEARYRLALAWNEAGDLKKALETLEEAVKLDPRHARAWYNLGLARNQAGDPEGALNALERAETLAPKDPRIPYARATILIGLGRLDAARAAAARALELAPDFKAARELLRQIP